MKINKVETFKCWAEWKNWLFVKVSTDEGLYGWGEASLAGPITAVEETIHALSEVLIGQDPSGVERHWQSLYNTWRWRGGSVQSTAMAGLDIALWDLEGKRLGVPVYRLLGGPFRPRVRCYASHWLIGATNPEQVAESAREAVRRGFTAFKWSPFTVDRLRAGEEQAIADAARLMQVARETVGPDFDIFVECGEKFSRRTAIAAARAFAPYRPGWF
jgi:galactonate dehydratase